ncbi:MAG: 30S ribosomal protein S16 [Myxococcota bacterium]
MGVRIRLQRHGAKKRPFYRVVATDVRAPRDGRFIELLGTYDPLQEPPAIRLKSDRIQYWVGVGAKPSETAQWLIERMEAGEVIDLSQQGAEAQAIEAARAARQKQIEDERAATAAAAKAAQDAAAAKAAEEAAAAEAAAAEAAAAEQAASEDAPEEVAEDASADDAGDASEEG